MHTISLTPCSVDITGPCSEEAELKASLFGLLHGIVAAITFISKCVSKDVVNRVYHRKTFAKRCH